MLNKLLNMFGSHEPYSRIAFERTYFDKPLQPEGIYTISPDGSDCRLICKGGKEPKWSPDGKWIAFRKDTDNRKGEELSCVFVMDVNGKQVRQVTFNDDMNAYHPTWSPDSKRLAYTQYFYEKNINQIFVVDLASGKSKQLTHKFDNDYPVWSPDNQITFLEISDPDELGYPSVMDPDGQNKRALSLFDREDRMLCWTYDGTKVVFERDDKHYVMNSDGSGLQTIPISGKIPAIVISPDGQTVAYSKEGESQFEVFSINLDGSDAKKIVANPSEVGKDEGDDTQDISWSPLL